MNLLHNHIFLTVVVNKREVGDTVFCLCGDEPAIGSIVSESSESVYFTLEKCSVEFPVAFEYIESLIVQHHHPAVLGQTEDVTGSKERGIYIPNAYETKKDVAIITWKRKSPVPTERLKSFEPKNHVVLHVSDIGQLAGGAWISSNALWQAMDLKRLDQHQVELQVREIELRDLAFLDFSGDIPVALF